MINAFSCLSPLHVVNHSINAGSYMSAPLVADIEDIKRVFSFFIKLLNKLGKRDKMLGLPTIVSLFHNEFQ